MGVREKSHVEAKEADLMCQASGWESELMQTVRIGPEPGALVRGHWPLGTVNGVSWKIKVVG